MSTSLTVTAGAATGASSPVRRINQHRRTNEIVLYTQRYGGGTLTDAGGTEVVLTGVTLPLAPTGLHAATVQEVRAGIGDTPTGEGTVVLSGVGTGRTFLDQLVAGDTLDLSLSIAPGWEAVRHAIGGRERMVRDGVAVEPESPAWTEKRIRAARSASPPTDAW